MNLGELVAWIKALLQQGNIKAFYNSAAWERLRQEVLEEQHHECQLCKAKGLFSPADTVHHKEAVRKRPDLALTKRNLQALCNQCHYEIHHTKKHREQLNEERW